jgi:hypothetical protein
MTQIFHIFALHYVNINAYTFAITERALHNSGGDEDVNAYKTHSGIEPGDAFSPSAPGRHASGCKQRPGWRHHA